jgi:Ni/Fe-hydrogenase subunit HybB-like protein
MGRMFFRFDWEHHGIWVMFGLMILGFGALGAILGVLSYIFVRGK